MKANIGKGTEVFSFFGDLFRFIGEYYIPEKEDEYWNSAIKASEELLKKYQRCEFYSFAQAIVVAYFNYLDSKYRQR